MPTSTHELFEREVSRRMDNELERLKRENTTIAYILERIHVAGHETIFIEGETEGERSRHEPDLQWCCEGAKWQTVVGEVFYSQSRKELVDLADKYIVGSEGGIQLVLGFDIEYGRRRGAKNSKKATVSIWRRRFEEEREGDDLIRVVSTEEDKPRYKTFRNENGDAVEGSLSIPVRAFIADDVILQELGKFEAAETRRQVQEFFDRTTIEIPFRRPRRFPCPR